MSEDDKYTLKQLLDLIISYDKTGLKGMYTSSKWVTKKTLLELFTKREDIFFGSQPIKVISGKNKTKRTIYHLVWNKLKY